MKQNELINTFQIYTTNEEKVVLETIGSISYLDSFDERDQVIIDNLVRKSVLSKFVHRGKTMVLRNEC